MTTAAHEQTTYSIGDRVRLTKDAVEGLHLLRMAASSHWLVRQDLTITLETTVHAGHAFGVDIDIARVESGLPEVLRSDDPNEPIWLPVLRIPSYRPTAQRITGAVDGQDNALPVMPQGDVRYRLAAALAWLFLNGRYRAEQPLSLAAVTAVERGVHSALLHYLTTQDRSVVAHGADQLTASEAESEAVQHALAALRRAVVEAAEHQGTRNDDSFVHAIEFARTAYFAVVGVAPKDRTPHVRCLLLPAELQVHTEVPPPHDADGLLGFARAKSAIEDQRPIARSSRWLTSHLRRLTAPVCPPLRPAQFHLCIPVPEVANLSSVRVNVHAHDDVCLNPSVLHHDTVARSGDHMQSRMVDGTGLVESSLDHLVRTLKEEKLTASPPVVTILKQEILRLEGAWEDRKRRLLHLHRLSDKTTATAPPSEWEREAAAETKTETDDLAAAPATSQREGPEAQRSPTQRASAPGPNVLHLDRKLHAYTEAEDFLAEARRLRQDLDDKKLSDPVHLRLRLDLLRQAHHQGPHLEMTADDDPRDHVAHFHVDDAPSVFRKSSDERPVIHGIVRPSKQAREDYMSAAFFSCLVSFLLLIAVALAFTVAPGRASDAFNNEALVALLLLVPGVSLTLLERIPGDSFRYLVLQRSIVWSRISLIPPVVAAVSFAVLLRDDVSDSADWATRLLWLLTVIGAWIAWGAHQDRRRHQDRFNYTSQVKAKIVYQEEDVLSDEAIFQDLETSSAGPFQSSVDMRLVEQETTAALFRADRPNRRFMVWATIPDQPGLFRQVIEALERIPDELTGRVNEPNPSVPASLLDELATWARGPVEPVLDLIRQALVPGTEAPPLLTPSEAPATEALAVGDDGGPTSPATREQPQVVTESAVVIAVATTGVVMAIISCDPEVVPTRREDAERLIKNKLAELLSKSGIDQAAAPVPNADGTVRPDDGPVVDEILDDAHYFRRNPTYIDCVYSVTDGDHDHLTALVDKVLEVCERESNGVTTADGHSQPQGVRLSYLHCPIRPNRTGAVDSERPTLTLKIGLAIERHLQNRSNAIMLRLAAIAERFDAADHSPITFTPYQRRAHPDRDTLGARFDGLGIANQESLTPLMLLAAGRSEPYILKRALTNISSDDRVVWEGGSILSAGGYSARAFRLWVPKEQSEPPMDRPIGSTLRVARTPGSIVDEEWRTDTSDLTPIKAEGIAPAPQDEDTSPETRWITIWLQWQLRERGYSLTRLLTAAESFGARLHPADPTAADDAELRGGPRSPGNLNIEYLTNRLDDRGYTRGKARYRLRIDPDVPGRRKAKAGTDDDLRRGLQAELRSALSGVMTDSDCFLIVSEVEPRRPATNRPRRPGTHRP